MMNALVAAEIGQLFGQETRSDCIIVFYLANGSLSLDDGQPSENGGASTRPGDVLGDPLPGHLLVLTFASPRITAQVDRWQGYKPAPTDEPPQKRAKLSPEDSRPELRIPLGAAQELHAARAAIAYAYTGAVRASTVREVLEVRQQGKYLQTRSCAAACVDTIKSMLAGGNQQQQALLDLYACEELWPHSDEDTNFTALLSSTKAMLVSHFGDALAVLNTPSLHEQFLALPAVGLEALLESDDFGTDSESTVLLMLATWMEANHAKTDEATRKRLCGLVRLVQLSWPYLTRILLALAYDYDTGAVLPAGWLPVSMDDASFIISLARAGPEERQRLEKDEFLTWDPRSPMYSTTPRRQCIPADGLTFPWNISEGELEYNLKRREPGWQRQVGVCFEDEHEAYISAAGFWWDVGLDLDDTETNPGLFLCCVIPFAYLASGSRLAKQEAFRAVVPIDAQVEVHRWTDGVQDGSVIGTWGGYGSAVHGGYSWRYREALPLRPPVATSASSNSRGAGDLLAPWVDYLHDGEVTGTLTVLPPTGPQ